MYLQHLALVKPSLLPSAMVESLELLQQFQPSSSSSTIY